MTENNPESESNSGQTATRREAMAGVAGGLALLLGFDIFGDEEDAPVQLTEDGQAIIDLDDISELELGNGLDAEKDHGTVTVSAQEVEDALLTVLDSGSEASTTVDEVNFGSGLDVTSPSSNRVDVAASGGDGGGGTVVASGTETVTGGDSNYAVDIDIPRDGNYELYAYPDADYTGNFVVGGPFIGPDTLHIGLGYNPVGSSGDPNTFGWGLQVLPGTDTATVTWEVEER